MSQTCKERWTSIKWIEANWTTKGRTAPRNDNTLRFWQLETVEFALRAQMRITGSGRTNNYREKSDLGNSCTICLSKRKPQKLEGYSRKLQGTQTKNANGSTSSEQIKRSYTYYGGHFIEASIGMVFQVCFWERRKLQLVAACASKPVVVRYSLASWGTIEVQVCDKNL